MNKILYTTLIVVVFSSSCSQLSQSEKELRENINKTLHLSMFETVQQANTLFTYDEFRNQHKFLSIIYLQNGCQPCYPKFIEWHKKTDSLFINDNYALLFIIEGDNYSDFMSHILDIEYVEDKYYTIMDPDGKFFNQNKNIPGWIINSSILIDAENKIKMVGAPWLNEDMTELFYKTVNS